jgi:hypothetical protein
MAESRLGKEKTWIQLEGMYLLASQSKSNGTNIGTVQYIGKNRREGEGVDHVMTPETGTIGCELF